MLLSIIDVHVDNSRHYTFPAPANGGGGDGGGSTVVSYACQATTTQGGGYGLFGALGLGPGQPSSSMTCVPASTVVTH
jgi:hypothetical protein